MSSKVLNILLSNKLKKYRFRTETESVMDMKTFQCYQCQKKEVTSSTGDSFVKSKSLQDRSMVQTQKGMWCVTITGYDLVNCSVVKNQTRDGLARNGNPCSQNIV